MKKVRACISFFIVTFIISLIIVTSNISMAEILFEDNFDNSPDWQSNQTVSKSMPDGHDKIVYAENCTTDCPPQGWDGYYVASSNWTDDPGKDTYILSSAGRRGDSGKGITYNMECTGTWSGGRLQVKLKSPKDELYVRFYAKYQSGFQWTDGVMYHGQQKLMRITSYPGIAGAEGVFDSIFGFGTAYYNTPVFYPDWYHNSGFNTTKFRTAERYGPGYVVGTTGDGKSYWPRDGAWHSYEFYVKLNSEPGVGNGEWKFYLDGVEVDALVNRAWVGKVAWKVAHSYNRSASNVITPTSSMKGFLPVKSHTSGGSEPDWDAATNINDIVSDGNGNQWQFITDFKWNHLLFLDNFYASHDKNQYLEQAMYLDDVVVSTEPIDSGNIIGIPQNVTIIK